jgi:hypothetical protein
MDIEHERPVSDGISIPGPRLAIDLDGASIGRIQTFVPPARPLPPGTFEVGIGLRPAVTQIPPSNRHSRGWRLRPVSWPTLLARCRGGTVGANSPMVGIKAGLCLCLRR